MAIGTPVGLGFITSGTAGSSLTLTTGAAVAAGDSIIVGACLNSIGATVTSVTDSAGNVYAIDKQQPHASVALSAAVASCHNALALPSGGTITVTWSGSVAGKHVGAATVSGLAHTGTADQTAGNQGSGTTWSSGATAATTQADELAIGVALLGGTTASTPTAPWAEIYDETTGSRRFELAYRVLSATGAVTASGVAGSASWTALAATYKGAGAGPDATVVAPAAQAVVAAAGPLVSAGATITAAPGTSTASAVAPTVTGDATVTAPAAGSTASAPAPAVASEATVAAPAATADAVAPPPTVTGGGAGDATVVAVACALVATAPAPTLSADASVVAVVAIITATAPPPVVTGTSPPEQTTPASGLFVELTTLHYPDTPATVLAVCQQYDGLEVAIPLGVADVRTGKVTLSIYDDRVLKPVLDYLESNGEDELAYAVCLRVRYFGLPVLWGPITLPEWNGGAATVTLNAVGPELRLQHQYLKDGDPTSSGPLAESGKYSMSTEGLRYLRDAGINEPADNTHNVPDLGIVDGSEAVVPPELSPVPRLTFRRHDEIWRQMQELSSHELAPDFEIAPVFDVAGAYARLNCYFPQGTDRTGAVRFYYGFGPDNLADFTSTPGGKIVTRATFVSSDDKVRKRATSWVSASFRGIYGQVEATDYDSTSDSVGEALTLRAKREVRKYREPPKALKVTLKPEKAITDPLRRYRYGRDFLVGDTVYVNAKKGWMRYDGDARITKVTLRQTKDGVVADLDLVPDVGDGTPETGDG